MRLLGAMTLVLLALAGCGGGDRMVETRQVAAFDRLEVSESVDVKVVPGDGRQVRVHAGEHVIDRVVTESSGGVLEIDVRDRGIVIGADPLNDVEVEVQVSALAGVEIDGSSDVLLENLDSERFELELNGAADLEATGSVDELIATIDGAGNADLLELRVRTARVVADGAADAELNVSEALDVTADGASDISYTGDPVVRSDVSGAADLRRIGP